jgi:hypothetical protein
MLIHRSLPLLLGFGALVLSACNTSTPALDTPADQTITFGELADRFVDAPPFELSAAASSGLPVTFAADGVCSVEGATVTVVGVPGTCTVTASQPGDDGYRPASDVARSFDVLAVPVPSHAIGFALFTEVRSANEVTVDVSGTFVAREGDLPATLGDVLDPVSDGTCDVIPVGSGTGGTTPVPDPTGTVVHAGDTLSAETAATTYATLTSPSLGTYQLASPLSAALPSSGLTLDVPGDAFPAFADAPFPTTDPFTWAPGFDPDVVTTATTFIWEAGQEGDVALLVGGDESTVFSCLAADDGSFSFGSATVSTLDAAGFTTGAIHTAGRLAVTPTIQGDAALLLGVLRLASETPAVTTAAISSDVFRSMGATLAPSLDGSEE